MRTIGAIVITLAILVATTVYSNFGTLSPCGVLRETVRQRDGLAAILPDSLIDMDIAAQHGPLSQGRCLDLLLAQKPVLLSTTPQPAAQQVPPIPTQTSQAAFSDAAKKAIDECKAKRMSGELTTFSASAQCSNPRLIQAFSAAHYKYMDLIQALAMKRLEISKKIDSKELTEDQAQLEYAKFMIEVMTAERQRDALAR
jgi:hypothetical protein